MSLNALEKLQFDERLSDWLNGSGINRAYPFCLNQCPTGRGPTGWGTCCSMKAEAFLAYLYQLYPTLKADCPEGPCAELEPEESCTSISLAEVAIDNLEGCEKMFGITVCGITGPSGGKKRFANGVDVEDDPTISFVAETAEWSVTLEAYYGTNDDRDAEFQALGGLRFHIAWLSPAADQSWVFSGTKEPNFCVFDGDGTTNICVDLDENGPCDGGTMDNTWECDFGPSCTGCCDMCNGGWGNINNDNQCCVYKDWEFTAIGYKGATQPGKMCYDLTLGDPEDIPGEECLDPFNFDYFRTGHPDFFNLAIPAQNKGNQLITLDLPTIEAKVYIRQGASGDPTIHIHGDALAPFDPEMA